MENIQYISTQYITLNKTHNTYIIKCIHLHLSIKSLFDMVEIHKL